jgi:diguanylate cyclase (GGDEF)-like protein
VVTSRISRVSVAVGLDVAIFVAGLLIAVPAVAIWVSGGGQASWTGAISIVLIVVMSRFPLVLSHGSGDVVIGFETAVLVFLSLTVPPIDALALWVLGTTLANATQRKVWRSRIFNIGLTNLGGALFVCVVWWADVDSSQLVLQLVAVMLACALYFAFDLIVTAGSLAIEDGVPLGTVLRWGSVPLGLACFVSVDTLGYLASLLTAKYSSWTLLLLFVPVGTILVAVRSVSDNRLAQRRLMGLLEAATQAPDWVDDAQIESSLLEQAERTLRQATASMRDEPPVPPEIGTVIEVEGRPTRHLVVTPHNDAPLDARDQAALEALTAVGVSAFNRRRLSDEMTFLARHDALTGLHNRAVFTDRLSQALVRRAPRGQVAVLYADLDGFKEVNDLLGHETGDRLLVQVADRIMSCLRTEDTAARLGGDEFGILLDDLTDETQADAVAQRLLDALAVAFHVGEREVRVRASIGIAFSDQDSTTAEMLINSADTAMYVAKSRGKSRVERFLPAMREAELNRLELEGALRQAVVDERITVHFQPVVDLATGSIDGFEALARWTDPKLGFVPPNVFIAAAEKIGVIGELGIQILEMAHAGGLQLARRAGRPMSLGVNLSALQVNDTLLAQRVSELHRSSNEVRLILELTEGAFLGDEPATLAALHRLRASGARLAIDDFGVGYSSVGYLHRLPVDILKLDKLFVSELHDKRSLALVRGVVDMARAMRLTVVTEGVEEWDSARALRDLKCDLAQGYVFSRPVPLDEALALAEMGTIDMSAMAPETLGTVTQLWP